MECDDTLDGDRVLDQLELFGDHRRVQVTRSFESDFAGAESRFLDAERHRVGRLHVEEGKVFRALVRGHRRTIRRVLFEVISRQPIPDGRSLEPGTLVAGHTRDPLECIDPRIPGQRRLDERPKLRAGDLGGGVEQSWYRPKHFQRDVEARLCSPGHLRGSAIEVPPPFGALVRDRHEVHCQRREGANEEHPEREPPVSARCRR